MKKLSEILNNNVNVNIQNLNSELIYITESKHQVGSLVIVYDEKKASIFSVDVLSNHRGKGYGKKLVVEAINRCKEKNCESIELRTEVDNTVANSLYLSMGFKLNGLKDEFNNYIKDL